VKRTAVKTAPRRDGRAAQGADPVVFTQTLSMKKSEE
jgi:hypothetical protein